MQLTLLSLLVWTLQRPPSWHDPLSYHVPQALWTTPVSKNYPLYSDRIDHARTGTKQIPALREFHCHHLGGATAIPYLRLVGMRRDVISSPL